MTHSQSVIEKANNAIAKGSKVAFEILCNIFSKEEANSAKKQGSKSNANKWAQRDLVNNTVAPSNPTVWLADKNRENAMKNLPSALR